MKRYGATDDAQFDAMLSGFSRHPAVQALKGIPQHKGNTTFAHSLAVAACAYRMAKRCRLEINSRRLIRGAMLHDFYLYDTETMPWSDYKHSLIHPKLALQNAEKSFELDDQERNIILSHMFPIPGAPLPRCREAWLVCLADKLCAWREMRKRR